MVNDPYTDMAQWLDMDARAESIMRHPAGKKLGDFSGVDWKAMYEQSTCERDEADALRCRMKALLDGISEAINPPEPPLVRWGFSDLPEKVRDVVRERDEWKARAEQLERALAASRDAHQRSADAHMEWKARAEAAEARTVDHTQSLRDRGGLMTKVHAHLAWIKDQERDVIAVPDGTGRALCVSLDKHWTFTREWDELHIIAPLVEENAEARTAPAVSRADIEKVIRGEDLFERQIDAVWSLLSGDDPAVYVVRESDIAAVKVEPYGDNWKVDGWVHIVRTLPEARADIQSDAQVLARSLAVARAIEAGQATDPIEEKARELYWAATPDARWETVADEYRRIAAHVLGQEASSDEDKGAISNPTPDEADTNA